MKLSVFFVFSMLILSAHGIPKPIKNIIKEVLTSLASEEKMVLDTAKSMLSIELSSLKQTGVSLVGFGGDVLSLAFTGVDLERKVNDETIADGGMNEICVNAHMNDLFDLIDTNVGNLGLCGRDLFNVFIPSEMALFEQIKALLQVQKDIISRFEKCVKETVLAPRCMSNSEKQTKTDIDQIQAKINQIKIGIADLQTDFTLCQSTIVEDAKNQSTHIFWEFQECQHHYVQEPRPYQKI